MERPVQCVPGIERVNIFGVRHFSPAACRHLLWLLERTKPKCVLIEGPTDATDLISSLTDEKVKPPVAILAYTSDLPVETVAYPFAEYSPEYQAMLWAKDRAVCRFIDLPSGALLYKKESLKKEESDEADGTNEAAAEYHEFSQSLYDGIVHIEQAASFDDYFERVFEHNLNEGSYNALSLESGEMRQMLEHREALALPCHNARNLVREAYMAGSIQDAMEEGYGPEEIVVITGAYHAGRLSRTVPMTGGEFKSLPKRESKTTLMPYSFYRLSSRSGYGAGNNAPATAQATTPRRITN